MPEASAARLVEKIVRSIAVTPTVTAGVVARSFALA
jgi:hypothetical protein